MDRLVYRVDGEAVGAVNSDNLRLEVVRLTPPQFWRTISHGNIIVFDIVSRNARRVPSTESEQDPLADLISQSISVSEACEISGFTPGWIRQLLIRGELQGFKIGRDWRLTRSVLQEYLDKERRPGPKTD